MIEEQEEHVVTITLTVKVMALNEDGAQREKTRLLQVAVGAVATNLCSRDGEEVISSSSTAQRYRA